VARTTSLRLRTKSIAEAFVAHPVARVLGLVLVSRLALLAVLVTVRVVLPEHADERVLGLLCRWDCHHYLRIAQDGYFIPAESGDALPYAFFPLFPLIIGLIADLTPLTPLIAGIAMANVLFAAAMVYVYYYARDVGFSNRAAMLGVTFLAFAPPSVVFSAPMTESLFVLLLAAAVFHLRRADYVAAAVAAAALSATRPNGIAFVVFAVIWLLRDRGWRDFVRPWTKPVAYLPIVLAPLGLFAYWMFSFATTGDAFAHASTNRHGWGWGRMGAIDTLALLGRIDEYDLILVLTGLAALCIALLLLRYRLYAEFGLVLASLAFFWSGGLAPVSIARFALALFPLAVALGRALAMRPGLAGAAVGTAATLNGLFTTVGWVMAGFVV
jgi:hypothetical protein